ncbi:MAG: delta-60 repeat domain-containing protein [Acidimicrobiales bacterium]|nr:delta-60 repeat domain-containing protein [Acidimicrobiales bacterium]
MIRSRGTRLALLLAGLFVLVACQPAADTITTTTIFSDSVDIAPGDGTCADAAGACSLRAAVMEGNATPGIDEIQLLSGTYSLTLVGADEDAGATGDLDFLDSTYLVAAYGATIDASGLGDRIIDIHGGDQHQLRRLELTGGDVQGAGGAVRAGSGTLVAEVDAHDNTASAGGGAIRVLTGYVALEHSSLHHNTAATGGGLDNEGVALVTNSTISDNTGGGVRARAGLLTLTFTTVTKNQNGGVKGNAIVVAQASIVADQISGADCANATFSNGYNADSDNSCGFAAPTDVPGSAPALEPATPAPGGGFPGYRPGVGSPIQDLVPEGAVGCGTTHAVDQHHRTRRQDVNCDLGAFEAPLYRPAAFCSLVTPAGAVVWDGSAYYVGSTDVARCLADGSLDPTFAPGLGGPIDAMAISGNWLYVVGDYMTTIDGDLYSRAARVDVTTGLVDPNWRPQIVGSVRAVAVHLSGVLVGGNITIVDGTPVKRLVRLSEVDGSIDPGFVVDVENSTGWENVQAITIHRSGDVLIGGMFDTVNGTSRSSVARLDPASAAVQPFDPDLTDTNPADPMVQVESIVEHGGKIYLCGDWWETEGIGDEENQRNVGRFDPATGAADLTWLPSIGRGLRACAIDNNGTELVVTGDHNFVNGTEVGAVQGIDLATGLVDTGWLPDPNTTVGVTDVVITATDVVFVGEFTSVAEGPAMHAARYTQD